MLEHDSTSAVRRRPSEDAPRRKGRPLEMSPDEVLQCIRRLGDAGGLFRVHREHPSLYARARRIFGSWADAIRRAGYDYASAVTEARRRAVSARRMRDAARAAS